MPERAANCGHQRSPTGRRPGQPTRCTSGGAGLVPLACAGHRSPGDRCMSGKLEHPARACEHPRRPDCQGCSSTRCTQAPPGIRGATGSVKGWRRSNSLSIASRWAVAVTLTGEPGMARTRLKHAGILRIRSSPPAEGAGAVSAGPGQTAEDVGSARYIRKREDVDRYTLAFDHLRASALPDSKSAELIRRLAHDD